MFLSRILLLIFIQDIAAIQDENLIIDDENYINNSNEIDWSALSKVDISFVKDTSGNNYHDAVTNNLNQDLDALTSNGVINILKDAMLLLTVRLRDLQNISIIGHNNPIVNCDNAGGIHFENCRNCTIIGITWEECGIEEGSKPAIKLGHSSDVIIRECTFRHSAAQALALTEMSGNVTINGCRFVFNNHYAGHGTAIHYLSKIKHYSEFQLKINNCNFTHNGMTAKSIVWISPSSNKSMEQIMFTNIEFLHNLGIPIYISHQNVFISKNILLKGNIADKSGGIFITNHSNVIFLKSHIKFSNNKALDNGGTLHIEDNSNVTFEGNSMATINDNQAKSGGALYIVNSSGAKFEGNTTIIIINNQAKDHGGALCVSKNSVAIFKGNSALQIHNNIATKGGAIYIEYNSSVTFEGKSQQTIGNNQASIGGGAFYIFNTSSVVFKGSPKVAINNNQATIIGGAFNIFCKCDVKFEENFTVTVNNNQANFGGAFGILNSSAVMFNGDPKSTATINNNQAASGGAFYVLANSNVKTNGNTTGTINYNWARYGGALYISSNCGVIFEGSSAVTINNNQAREDGGALYISDNSEITFGHNSTIIINNNKADNHGGALCFWYYCGLTLKGNTSLLFYNNSASINGGALYARDYCDITVKGNSTAVFINNEALGDGGALYTNINSVVTFRENSSAKFNNNKASQYGGALYFRNNCNAFFEEATFVVFYNNTANTDGGGVYAWNNCTVTIKGNCTTVFDNNKALGDGGALNFNVNSAIKFQDNSTGTFNGNKATYFGGALGSNCNITIENNCVIAFTNNEASQGGAIFTVSDIAFKDNSTVKFDNNRARTLGGALCTVNLTFSGNTEVTFSNNEAILNGGALYSDNANVTIKQKSTVAFINNGAKNGGAVFISASTLLVSEHSNVTFDKNAAREDGGAIYFNDHVHAVFKNSTTITFSFNVADNHGGAVYSKITQSKKYFNISEINFNRNAARVAGNILYIDVTKSCNGSCFADGMVGVSPSDKEISTSPNLLKLYHPAKCISNNSTECEEYYIDNVMLGQEITINVCLLDHYNKPAEVTQFKFIGENHQNYFMHGSEYTSISCNHTIEGISIQGNKSVSNLPLNYSILVTSYATGKSVRKIVSVNVTVGLSPCHPGFQYNSKSQMCECYNTSGVVYCSGSSSAIKRGYWFGNVNGISTVTFCPINYCNFTCCKTTNGYYELSPVRVNQCRSHRSGAACGSCEEGYTLSFDSAECININRCTTGQMILIITVTVIYWFVVVIAVFIIMYYQVGIGYFYAVTYYYSVVDILLSQHIDISNGLYITVTIMSSVAKITPQFLGHLCLSENMSGIDQQFMHYIHPLAISVILIFICWLARKSKRLSMCISRGIIRAICFLLLLSYTSMATTSLLLMRSLTFVNVDNFYTYLSPNIQYFHGRHLVYGIIAIIFGLLIVIGLPLLLLLEPFLNGKINFVKIKPLLDQFQGCYKDKYRWFAAYYMICRLIMISVIIANLSETFISRYLLIAATTTMALIHLLVRPYTDDILNMCDGAILQLMILVTVLPLFEYFDTPDSSLIIGIAFVLVILPLVQFIVMKVFTSKQTLMKITKKTIKKFSSQNLRQKNVPISSVACNTPTFVSLTIDDNMRRNAIVCEM